MTPPELVTGSGSFALLGTVLAKAGVERALVVSGRRTWSATSGAEQVRQVPDVRVFQDFLPNPTIEDVEGALTVLDGWPVDAVVGVGGGSALDVAKMTSVLAAQEAGPRRCLADPSLIRRERASLLVLVPTTAGSGSEVTSFATVYWDRVKHSLDHPQARADVAIVDPTLLLTVPRPVAVAAGLDAVCHSVESLWSRHSTTDSRATAQQALDLAVQHLARSLDARDEAALGAMSQAATLAGRVIAVTRTTAAHALAYPMTSRHGVPHGVACALNLTWLLPLNAATSPEDCVDPRGSRHVTATVGQATQLLGGDPADAAETLRTLLELGGYGRRLSAYGIPAADLPEIVDQGLRSVRADNNPRRLTPTMALAGLRSIL